MEKLRFHILVRYHLDKIQWKLCRNTVKKAAIMENDKKERNDKPRYGDRNGSRGRGPRRQGSRGKFDKDSKGDFKGDSKEGFKGRPKKGFGDRSKERPRDRPRGNFKGRSREGSKGKRDGFRGERPSRESKERAYGKREVREEQEPQETRKLLLPQDASRLLYRGIDCQINGNNNLAMIMFLHGSVMGSEGCENNADRILKEIGKDGYLGMRAEILPNCSEDALTEFDYLCITHSKLYDRTYFDGQYSAGTTHAIYRRICLEEIDGDDPIIDDFASRYPQDGEKIMKGLDLLRRKKDSSSAERHLTRIEDGIKLKQAVNVMFTRAMNGDARAVRELNENAKKVPEAAFYAEYISARSEGKNVEWLRSKYPQYKDLIVSRQGEFKIQDTPFGMFLKAKSLEAKKEEWMSVMMNAAKAGSPEAMEELDSKMFRNDVRKCLASIYLQDSDLEGLLKVYSSGLDDPYYLDQYCGSDHDRVINVGRELGKQTVGKEIDWLKDHYDKGLEFCKDELIDRSKDEAYHCKKMIYALHDIGADMEAAELYFAMEDNPEVPSVKWLKKVCGDDSVKDYVRMHYEGKGDMATFDSIFEEDGYERRPKSGGGRGRPQGRRGQRRF